jgi:hypothetical protein
MIIYNGIKNLKKEIYLKHKILYSSWVPAIFTRNYEIYVSNYCWIHNVRKTDELVCFFDKTNSFFRLIILI